MYSIIKRNLKFYTENKVEGIFIVNILPLSIKTGDWKGGHIQGIAVDRDR